MHRTLMDARLRSWLNDVLLPSVVAVCDVPFGVAAIDAAGTLVLMLVVAFDFFFPIGVKLLQESKLLPQCQCCGNLFFSPCNLRVLCCPSASLCHTPSGFASPTFFLDIAR